MSEAQSSDHCISLVGDSVAYGTVVYEVPNHGFAILRSTPLSVIMQDALNESDLGHLTVKDRTLSATFLSDLGKNPYRETRTYQALLEDACQYVVMMPWINDLSVEQAMNAHIDDLAALIETIQADSPSTEFFILNFYYGNPTDFAAQHAPGYHEANIMLVNVLMAQACLPRGRLGILSHVTCMDIAHLFHEMDNAHVVLETSQTELEATLYEPIPTQSEALFEAYWRNNPQGLVMGDGVHLNQQGKAILTEALINAIQPFIQSDPD